MSRPPNHSAPCEVHGRHGTGTSDFRDIIGNIDRTLDDVDANGVVLMFAPRASGARSAFKKRVKLWHVQKSEHEVVLCSIH